MSAIRDALTVATADRKITAEEWTRDLKPLADATANEASAEAREVLSAYANDGFELDAAARTGMRSYLGSRGYEVPKERPAGTSNQALVDAILASNVSEVDRDFASLAAKAGKSDTVVNVAVLDSGFDVGHQALDTKLWTNPNEVAGDGLDNDSNGKVDDVHGWDFAANDADVNSNESSGHATHVTGIATAGSDNIDAIAIRAFSPLDGKKIAAAIDYAAANGARVMNMSFRVDAQVDKDAIVAAMKRHPEVLFCKSAGNDGKDLNGYNATTYLAKQQLSNLAIVAAADKDGSVADYSNFGTPYATDGARGSDVVASIPGNKFTAMSGTSMASPNVVNTAAKMLILDGGLSPDQVKGILADTTDRREDWASLSNSGGTINPGNATRLAGLTGLVRAGLSPEAAATQLELSDAQRSQLLPLVSKYVSA